MLRSGINRMVAGLVAILFLVLALIGFAGDSSNALFTDMSSWTLLGLALVLALGVVGGHAVAWLFNGVVGFSLFLAPFVVMGMDNDSMNSATWLSLVVGVVLLLTAALGIRYYDNRRGVDTRPGL